MVIEKMEAATAGCAVLTTKLYAGGMLIKETTDETVWCAVLNKIVVAKRSEQSESTV